MNCDVQSLLDAAKCYKCVPTGMLGEVQIYLLCQWLKKKEPISPVDWEPDTVIANWRDSGGNKTGDLATFSATADLATTDLFSINDASLTSISGLSNLPVLQNLDLSNSTSLTAIDLTGCSSLVVLGLHDTSVISIDASPCTSLAQISTFDNFSLVSVDVHGLANLLALDVSASNSNVDTLNLNGCTAMTSLLCGGTKIAALDVSTLSSLVTLDCNNCVNLTSLDCTGLSTLTTLNCYSCGLTTLTLTGCTGLVTLNCYFNPGPTTTLDCSGLVSLAHLNSSFCGNTSLVLTGCVSLVDLDCSLSPITSLDVSPCGASLLTLKAGSCALTNVLPDTGLTLTGSSGLNHLECFANPSLSSLTLTDCTALTYLDCNGCAIAALDCSPCVLLATLNCSFNPIANPPGLTLPGTAALTNLVCNDTLLTTLTITGCSGLMDITANNMVNLTSIVGGSALAAVTGFINLSNDPVLAALSFPNLTSCNSIAADGCTLLASFSAPSLSAVIGSLTFDNDTALTSVDLTGLLSIVSNLRFVGCSALASIDLSALTSANSIYVSSCSILSALDISVLIMGASAAIDCTDCSLPDSPLGINLVLARAVASGVTGGTFLLNGAGGGPNAAPTGQGLLDKATLLATIPPNTVVTN